MRSLIPNARIYPRNKQHVVNTTSNSPIHVLRKMFLFFRLGFLILHVHFWCGWPMGDISSYQDITHRSIPQRYISCVTPTVLICSFRLVLRYALLAQWKAALQSALHTENNSDDQLDSNVRMKLFPTTKHIEFPRYSEVSSPAKPPTLDPSLRRLTQVQYRTKWYWRFQGSKIP